MLRLVRLLTLVCLLAVAAGCSSDSTTEPEPGVSIDGTYTGVAATVYPGADDAPIHVEYEIVFSFADGVYWFGWPGDELRDPEVYRGTYTISGATITLSEPSPTTNYPPLRLGKSFSVAAAGSSITLNYDEAVMFPTSHTVTLTKITGSLITQTIAFGKEYINWAWGYRHEGHYIAGDGTVYEFSFAETDSVFAMGRGGLYAEGEIQQMLSLSTATQTRVPLDSLWQMYQLIKPVTEGAYSDTVQGGADMGEVITFAFLYSPDTRTYRRYELDARGDLVYRNLSVAATELDTLIRVYTDE